MKLLSMRTAPAALAVFLVAAAIFAPSIKGDFTFDDRPQIQGNAAVRNFDLAAIFTRGYWENVSIPGLEINAGGDLYRPLTTLSVAISHWLHGDEPAGYHAENVLLHAFVCVVLLYLLLGWGLGRGAAVATALLFALAPIHIEAVAGIILRNELLAALFSFGALLLLARGRSLLAGLATAAALLCKESSIALPLLALAADRVFLRPRLGDWRRAVRRYGPLLGACALYLLARALVLGKLTLENRGEALYFPDQSTPVVWLTMARFTFQHYLLGALFGAPLVFDFSRDSFPDAGPGDVLAWALLIAWGLLALGAFWGVARRRSTLAFGPLLALLSLAPTANLLVRIGVLGATRLMYLPYLGVALVLVELGRRLLMRVRQPPARRALMALGVAVLVGYALRCELRLRPWSHALLLYEDVLERAPRNKRALSGVANESFVIALGEKEPTPELADADSAALFSRALDAYLRYVEVDRRLLGRFLPRMTRCAFECGREEELAVAGGSLGRILPAYLEARAAMARLSEEGSDRAARVRAARAARAKLEGLLAAQWRRAAPGQRREIRRTFGRPLARRLQEWAGLLGGNENPARR